MKLFMTNQHVKHDGKTIVYLKRGCYRAEVGIEELEAEQ